MSKEITPFYMKLKNIYNSNKPALKNLITLPLLNNYITIKTVFKIYLKIDFKNKYFFFI
jgi:hypothetical protein